MIEAMLARIPLMVLLQQALRNFPEQELVMTQMAEMRLTNDSVRELLPKLPVLCDCCGINCLWNNFC